MISQRPKIIPDLSHLHLMCAINTVHIVISHWQANAQQSAPLQAIVRLVIVICIAL